MNIPDSDVNSLVSIAQKVRCNAYCPYSGFAVGAALLSESGKIFTGCNCENASFGCTICAERAALTSAISAGERKFAAIAIAAGDKPVSPCGICRQMLLEFGDMMVICAPAEGNKIIQTTLHDLQPGAFTQFK